MEGPRTYHWPAQVSYRFTNAQEKQNILLYVGDITEQTTWYLWASSDEELARLEEILRHCPTLKDMEVEPNG